MALAILDLIAVEKETVRFRIDVGTSTYYQLRIGRNRSKRGGVDWVDGVYATTPLRAREGSGLLSTSQEIEVPRRLLAQDENHAHVQLLSFKTRDGKSPAFSRVVRVPLGTQVPLGIPRDYVPPLSVAASRSHAMSHPLEPLREARRIPCPSARPLAQQASLTDLLGSLVKAAAPVVLDLLQKGGSGAPGSDGAKAAPAADPGAIVASLLKAVLGSGVLGTAGTLSTASSVGENRFVRGPAREYARPFIFGVDDALIGALAGPLLQVLPQLMNSANQGRLQLKTANNKLVTDLVSNVNQRMMLQQLLDAQRAQPGAGAAAGPAPDLQQLLQLLQQVAPAAGAAQAPAAAAAPAGPQSLSLSLSRPSFALSSTTLVSFVTAPALPWNGTSQLLFAKGRDLALSIRLDVPGKVPSKPIPKLIVRVVFKRASDQRLCFEKKFQRKDVSAGSPLQLAFSAAELAGLPCSEPLAVFAAVRWRHPRSGREYRACGSTEIALVQRAFVKERGGDVSAERELTDMQRFRSFWNKVWEAPVLGGGSEGHRLWQLDATLKYSVLLAPAQASNGLMDTKILSAPADPESVTRTTQGRMKGGIEIAIGELNKLAALWEGAAPLSDAQLDAFKSEAFARESAAELVYPLKLQGRAGERGMVWVIPSFKLVEFTLGTVSATDEAGQVIELADEKVRFPMPVSARLIGLKSAR